jgi:phospholipase/carboxylesterase
MSAQFTLNALQTDADSGLAYRVRLPLPQNPAKLLVLLHGVGGNETNLLGLAQGVAPDTVVVFPRGPLDLGPQQCAWFRVSFTASGPSIVPQEAEQSRGQLIALLAHLQSTYGVGAQSTVIAGFSQGGILSASVGLSAPHSVAGFGLLSGRILPELEPHLAEPARLATLKAFVGHGTHDTKLPVQWAQRADALLTQLGVEHTLRLYPMDHGISADMHADFVQWLSALHGQGPAVR